MERKPENRKDEDNFANSSLRVDPEFAGLLGPQYGGEYEELKADIIANGLRDPIITWNGTIIDGHNRYRVCIENHIPYQTQKIEFKDREEAKTWILTNQLSRRNISIFRKFELTTLRAGFRNLKEESRNKRLRNLRGQHDLPTIGNSESERGHINIQEEIARELRASKGTISKMQIIERGIEEGKLAPETIEALRRGDISVNEVYNHIKRAEGEGHKVQKNRIERIEKKKKLKAYSETIAHISGWQLAEILDFTEPDDRNELVTQIWRATGNLKKIGLGLANAKKHPEHVAMLSAGNMDISDFEVTIQGKRAERSSPDTKNEGSKEI